MTDLDRVIHEPARLLIVALLSGVMEADFLYLQKQSGLTKGNLSSHIAKGKSPLTVLRLTPIGRDAFAFYKETMGQLLSVTPTP